MSNKIVPRERAGTEDSQFFEKDTSDEVKLPEIEVSVKFYNLTRVDTANHEWDAEFVVMLDWMPTKGMEDFVPKIDIENAVEKAEPMDGGGSVRTRKDGHKTTTLRYHTTLVTRFDMREFPFDVQFLTVVFKSRRFYFKGKFR